MTRSIHDTWGVMERATRADWSDPEVPLAMAEQATRLATLLVEVAQIGNRHLATDAALSALLAETTLRGALQTSVNGGNVTDAVTLRRLPVLADGRLDRVLV